MSGLYSNKCNRIDKRCAEAKKTVAWWCGEQDEAFKRNLLAGIAKHSSINLAAIMYVALESGSSEWMQAAREIAEGITREQY